MRKEVSNRGKLLAFSIMGVAVTASIFIENFGAPDTVRNIPYIMLGALALAVILPMAFFRRPVG